MKNISSAIILTCVLALTTHFGNAQELIKCDQRLFNDPFLDKLTGQWIATGTVRSKKVFYKFSVQWVLNHQFVEMTFADTAINPQYTAKVFIGYDCGQGIYIVHWIDNFGGAYSETLGYGTLRDQSLEMTFNYPEGQLTNTFSFDDKSGEWTSH